MKRVYFSSIRCGALLSIGLAASLAQDSGSPARTAIQANADRFAEAFNARDAETVAAFWAIDGTWTDPASLTRLEGREAIQNHYRSWFEENPEARLRLQVVFVRVVSDELAIEEGRATVVSPDAVPSVSGYTAVHRKDGDNWLIEHIVESTLPEKEEPHPPGLEELEWLEGEWLDATETSTIQYENTWVAGGKFLRRFFTVSIEDRVDMTGLEIVGWDPVEKQIRSWVFDSEGGFGELAWRKGDGAETWVKKASMTFSNGEKASAIHVMTKLNDDQYTFKAVARHRDGQPLPNIDEVTVSRAQ